MGKIFCLMGKSATGKDSLYKELKKNNPWLETYVMYTTRPARNGEVNGRNYYFISKTIFERVQAENKVIEYRIYNTVFGPWIYATFDDGQIDLNRGSFLVIGTLESFAGLGEFFGRDNIVPIYIEVEDGERLQRAIDREKNESKPSYSEVCRRYLADNEDYSKENLSKFKIEKYYRNDNLLRCAEEISNDIKKCDDKSVKRQSKDLDACVQI